MPTTDPSLTLDLTSPLVSIDWLRQRQHASKLVILDASVPPIVPGFVGINTANKFQVIAGARRFDYDQTICKPGSSLPHMMPGAGLFEDEVRKLGVNRDSVIVVYDDVGIYASPRAWWMFRAMGHQQVAVLDGGLPAWIDAGLPVTDSLHSKPSPGNFCARLQPELFCDFEVVLGALQDTEYCILDARSAARFHGKAPEPRPGVRSGHMPNAANLPFPEVLNGGQMKSLADLEKIFEPLVGKDQTLITSCGSGLTACILTLAANLVGYDKLSVYDGSWAEWGAPSKLPVVTD